jgi:hypothetical protein
VIEAGDAVSKTLRSGPLPRVRGELLGFETATGFYGGTAQLARFDRSRLRHERPAARWRLAPKIAPPVTSRIRNAETARFPAIPLLESLEPTKKSPNQRLVGSLQVSSRQVSPAGDSQSALKIVAMFQRDRT